MNDAFEVPNGVLTYIRHVFSHVNDVVSLKMSITPNTPEESLDISFIESLSEFAGPRRIESAWAVRIAAHFIGSIRHYRRYEIADIGVVVVFKRVSKIVARKLVLLQSKRLYPLNNIVEELDEFDYSLGLGLITRTDKEEASIFSPVTYQFNERSVYGAMTLGSQQCTVIAEHFGETNIPVHYMMYNPIVLPWKMIYPLSSDSEDIPTRTFGARILESSRIHQAMAFIGSRSPPSLADLSNHLGSTPAAFGRPLETFFEDVVRCREGYRFSEDRDEGIRRLFSRKSGQIFCIYLVSAISRKRLRRVRIGILVPG